MYRYLYYKYTQEEKMNWEEISKQTPEEQVMRLQLQELDNLIFDISRDEITKEHLMATLAQIKSDLQYSQLKSALDSGTT